MANLPSPDAPLEWVTIKTTLPKSPYPTMANRTHILTDRLILRPYAATDLNNFHALRLQPEVMKWTSQGRPDTDLAQTETTLANRLPGTEGELAYEFAVCWAETGEMIGTGGSHMRRGEFGWPVIGYMIRSEFWGKGIATEIVNGFLKAWWALPREEVELEVEKSTVQLVDAEGEGSKHVYPECIVAITLDGNGPSQNVLRKTGFKLDRIWIEEDPEHPGTIETLYGFTLKRPESS